MDEKLRKLMIRQSELRTKINDLSVVETRSTEQDTELTQARNEYVEVEKQYRAALADTGESVEDAESREKREVRSKATLGNFMRSYVNKQPVSGAEAEWLAIEDVEPGELPLSMLVAPEVRAVTPGPAADTVTNTAATVHPLFERTVAPFLGIEMPVAAPGQANYPWLSTGLEAGFAADGADVPQGTGAYMVRSATPRRAGASFQFAIKDKALYPPIETDLRRDMSSRLADKVDDALLNDTGGSDDVNGLFNQLTNPTAASAVVDFDAAVKAYVDAVDGLFAIDETGIRMLVGRDTFRKFGATRNANTDSTLTSWLRANTGGLRMSNRVAAMDGTSKIQQCIIVRNSPDRRAVAPVWRGAEIIVDPYTEARKGIVTVTANLLMGGIVILRPDAYEQGNFKLAS